MARISAGLLMYRVNSGTLEVFLAHPGGPFFMKKDDGAWTIPKGEPDPGEDLLVAACREFEEETSLKPEPPFVPLKPIVQRGGKIVHAWAFEGDCDPQSVKSNVFTLEWPPKSGLQKEFPEIDRTDFFEVEQAHIKIRAEQAPLIDQLVTHLAEPG